MENINLSNVQQYLVDSLDLDVLKELGIYKKSAILNIVESVNEIDKEIPNFNHHCLSDKIESYFRGLGSMFDIATCPDEIDLFYKKIGKDNKGSDYYYSLISKSLNDLYLRLIRLTVNKPIKLSAVYDSLRNKETPFKHINFADEYTVYLYKKNKTKYYIVYDNVANCWIAAGKTEFYSDVLDNALFNANIEIKGRSEGSSEMDSKHHIGGNYYYISKGDFKCTI